MAVDWPEPKDPDEVLDYAVPWAPRLDPGDTIVTSTWPVVPDGIVKESDSHTDTVATIWLSGGTISTKYTLTNRIVTAGGRTMDQSLRVSIKAK
jgi:hypothetical protein